MHEENFSLKIYNSALNLIVTLLSRITENVMPDHCTLFNLFKLL